MHSIHLRQARLSQYFTRTSVANQPFAMRCQIQIQRHRTDILPGIILALWKVTLPTIHPVLHKSLLV